MKAWIGLANLSEGDVAPVSEGRDDQAGGAAQVLVVVVELRVADVAVAIVHFVVPPEPTEVSFANTRNPPHIARRQRIYPENTAATQCEAGFLPCSGTQLVFALVCTFHIVTVACKVSNRIVHQIFPAKCWQ